MLELRDPGGEDVRVAMVINLSHSHTSHRDHRSVSLALPGQASMTTGMIIGRRRWVLLTHRPMTRRIVCCSW